MPDLAKLARMDAIAQAALCARGEVSHAELFDECVARIDALNALLRVVVAVPDTRPSAPSKGPLSGVPMLVKDSLPWPGLRWSMGSRLFAHRVAQQSTPLGRRLAESGLVCCGKTAMSEFGLLASSETLLEGITHNPWSLAHSTAGSSGGSAAAVAAGIVPLAHASDGGGSIRLPASACGVFGFKPSRGRTVEATPASTEFGEMTSDHCISRSVRDSALFLSITEDPSTRSPVGFVRDPIDRPLRVGAWAASFSGVDPEPAVRRAYDETLKLLDGLGHIVEEIAVPAIDADAISEACFIVAGAAVAGIVDAVDRLRGMSVQRNELEPFSWALVEAYLLRAERARGEARSAFAQTARAYRQATQRFDVVLNPTIATEPWAHGQLSPVVGSEELIRRTARANAYAPIANISGCAAMSVPLHFSADALPIGVHFAAAPGADAVLLALAYQLEQACPWKDRWPPYSIVALFSD